MRRQYHPNRCAKSFDAKQGEGGRETGDEERLVLAVHGLGGIGNESGNAESLRPAVRSRMNEARCVADRSSV